MVEIVNLNKARKAKARAEKEQRAHDNRIKHGTPKAFKSLANDQKALRDKKLSGKRLSTDEPSPKQDGTRNGAQPEQPDPE